MIHNIYTQGKDAYIENCDRHIHVKHQEQFCNNNVHVPIDIKMCTKKGEVCGHALLMHNLIYLLEAVKSTK